MKNRIFAALAALLLILSLTACGTETGSSSKENDQPDAPGTVQTEEPGTSGSNFVPPIGSETTTIEYRGEKVEVIELPQLRLSDLHATPLEGTMVSAESAQDGDVKVYTLESTGRANPGNHGTKEGMTYFLVENALDIGISLDLYSYHVEDGVRAEKQEHYTYIRPRSNDTRVYATKMFEQDMSEYEMVFKEYDMKKALPNQAGELAAARVYRGVKDPTKLYVFVDATTETRIEGDMMVLLVKDGVVVNSVSWEGGFGTVFGESRTVDWRFTFEEDYDSVYVQLVIEPYNGGATFE